ncbi:RnfABCDGE type electron transport complex subunit G [Pseudomonas subflava]|uniref:RnfABCDGE type electron transport complex subunit G n=1 Tax=Pseudomonas subflava TaxID=2952933 RepID=UPI00207B0D07|nr:RnfABCDGE type electron transport complex subunit G [Pseudomonas subflava]
MKRAAPLLLLIVLLGAGLLAILQHVAAPRIEQQRQTAAERTLLDLLPAGGYDNRPLQNPIALPAGGLLGNPGAEPGYLARLNGRPSAVLLPVSARGYEGPIRLLVAITADGRLLASKVLQQQETPGLADLLAPERAHWLGGFTDKTLEANLKLRADGGQIDQIAGATVTSRAVTDALQRALRFFDAERERLLGAQP